MRGKFLACCLCFGFVFTWFSSVKSGPAKWASLRFQGGWKFKAGLRAANIMLPRAKAIGGGPSTSLAEFYAVPKSAAVAKAKAQMPLRKRRAEGPPLDEDVNEVGEAGEPEPQPANQFPDYNPEGGDGATTEQ